MQLKCGMTVMNCQSPNGADALCACVTLDAPNTRSVLQSLFESKELECEFHFNLDAPPSFGKLRTEDHQVLCNCVFNVASDSMTTLVTGKQGVDAPMPSSAPGMVKIPCASP